MREMQALHEWSKDTAAAISLQRGLATRVRDDISLPLNQIRTVAGVDVSARRGAELGRAAVALLSFPALALLEIQTHTGPLSFPYRTGLLSWRELPLILTAVAALSAQPDVYLVDGMGRMHPRRFGLACHLGLWLDVPTVGVGKTRLIGEYEMPALERGARQPVRQRDEVLGLALRTRKGVKPIFVSVGHRADLESAAELALACAPKYRLPEPIRAAHRAAAFPLKSAAPNSGRPS